MTRLSWQSVLQQRDGLNVADALQRRVEKLEDAIELLNRKRIE
jgi:hypothetical protein